MNSNIIINIPHSSTFIPENFLKRLKINQENLKQELELLTDLYTEDLFTNKSCNIIKADVSRIVCDMERFRDDKKETMSRVGMGAIYTKTSNGDELIEYDDAYKSRILSEFYDVYHKKFENTTNKVLKEYGRCVIIDCHSFSTELLRRLGMEHSDSPDICIGYEKEFVDMDILNTLKMHFEKCGLSVNFNYPYTGSIVPNKYYAKKDSRVKSLMIEVNKLLYLDENNHKNANYQRIKDIIQEAIEKVIAMEKIDTIER